MLILLSIPESILPPLHYSAALSIPERPPLLPPPRCTDLSILRVRPESCLYSPFLGASFLSPTQTTCSDHLIVDLCCAPFSPLARTAASNLLSLPATQLTSLANQLQAFISTRQPFTDDFDATTLRLLEQHAAPSIICSSLDLRRSSHSNDQQPSS